MGIFYLEPDILFYAMCLTALLSFFAGIIAFQNYRLIKSIDYLLITISHFCYTIWMIGWITWSYVYFNISIFVDALNCWYAQDPCQFNFINNFPRPIIQFAWSLGWLVLFLYAFRLLEFHNRSIIVKSLMSILLTETIALFVYVNLSPLYRDLTKNPYIFSYSDFRWFLKIWLMRLFFDTPVQAVNMDLIIIHIFIFFSYWRSKPVTNDPSINYSKYTWSFFSLTTAFVYFQFYLLNTPNSIFRGTILFFYEKLSLTGKQYIGILQFASYIPVMIFIVYYPKSMLMTKTQIIKASTLYKVFDLENKKERINLGNHTKFQIKEYLANLPEEIKEEINLSS